jgi:GTP pyrophosphokinase
MEQEQVRVAENVLPKYTLNEEQERKEILRQYRALLRACVKN